MFAGLLSMRHPVIALSLLMSLRYLIWRATSTINTQTPVHTAISVTLLAAEVYGYLSVALFYFQVRRPADNVPPQVAERDLPTVDVFIPIYNEPQEILHRTLVACAALDYPRDRLAIHVLDDGPRDSIRTLAERFGCRYLTRPDRTHAKAGNMNNGIKNSRGELILTLDCDHVPVSSFLRETVGYFSDPKAAFVQTPHHFYNADIFQHNLHLDDELVHEQDLFFQVIEPGRQRTNSVMFAGSAAVLRRSALESIGGIQTACAIEDTHTSMRLQARGWKGIYHHKTLSAGLSPESYAGYLTQRMRWTRGGVQLFVLDNPLLRPGLSLSQRLSYFSSVLYFFHGWSRLVYLVIPLAFLLGRYDPIVCGVGELMGYFLPHYLCAHLAVILVSREFRNPFWSDVYEAASAFSLSWTALVTILQPDKLIFNVTPKGEKGGRAHQIRWTYVLPHVSLILLLTMGMVAATRRMAVTGLELNSYSLSCLWAAFNVILLGCAIEGTRERPQLRSDHRVHRRLGAELSYHGRRFEGIASVLSESGGLIELDTDEHMPPLVRVRIFSDDYDRSTGLNGEMTELECEVVHQDMRGKGSRVGIRFTDMTLQRQESLVRQMFSAPDSWNAHERPFVSSVTAFAHIASSVLRPRLRKPARARRGRARVAVRLDAIVAAAGARVPVRILDLSVVGARISVPAKTDLPQRLSLSFAVSDKPIEILCRLARRPQPKPRTLFNGRPRPNGQPDEFGLKFLSPEHLDPGVIEELENAAS